MNQQEAISQLVKLYIEEGSLAEQIKDIKDEAKASGLNPTILSSVAKAIANNKVDELKEKSEELLKTISVARS
jgi:uncharacterized protein (UPF0335 family)